MTLWFTQVVRDIEERLYDHVKTSKDELVNGLKIAFVLTWFPQKVQTNKLRKPVHSKVHFCQI